MTGFTIALRSNDNLSATGEIEVYRTKAEADARYEALKAHGINANRPRAAFYGDHAKCINR